MRPLRLLILVLAVASAPAFARIVSWSDIDVYTMGGYRVGKSDFSTTSTVSYNAKEVGGGVVFEPRWNHYVTFGAGLYFNWAYYDVSQSTQRLNSMYGYNFGPEMTLQITPDSDWHPYFRAGYIAVGRKHGTGSKGGEKLDASFSSEGAGLAFGYEFNLKYFAVLIEYDVRAERVKPESVKIGSRAVTDYYVPADYDSAGYLIGLQRRF